MTSNLLIHLTAESFDREVMQSAVPVLVDFWAPWCGPCRAVGPIVEELANEYSGQVKIAKLNTDDYPEIAQRFRVMSIPTLILFQGGRILDTAVGAQPKASLKAFIHSAIPGLQVQ
jgi:thioredoxin 1